MRMRVEAAAPPDVPYASYRCMDAQEQAGVLQGWNQRYWQLSRGAFEGRVKALDIDGAYVFLESANRTLLQRGALAPGALGVAVPLHLAGEARFCGRPCSLDQLYVYSGDAGFEFCSPADHQVAGIALAASDLPLLSAQAAALRRTADLVSHAHTRISRPEALDQARELVVSLLQAAAQTPALLHSDHARAQAKDAIIATLVELLATGEDATSQPLAVRARWQLVKRARERIAEHPEEPVTVATLCADLGVSRRTLQYCFRDVLGISPLAYLRAMRLNGVRAALQTARSVTEAAVNWGFWHLGQFSADYRAMFGERPSDTFNRHRPPLRRSN